jgi:hypothetical protein
MAAIVESDARRAGRTSVRDALLAALAYTALTLVLTWPVVRGLARDLPAGFGDPLLNAWILTWDADHLLRALEGHPGALTGYWNANIYYPHPLALAYSEHLTAQALQIVPVYALSRNPLLAYNLLFLSTFVLSGLGMFLLARDLTGSPRAAFVAGLAYAFAPYRFGSIPHLQVLSSAWMPFTLFGFRRFFDTRRTRPLVGAAAAWILQNLSCSYYLLFFAPVVGLYLAWELAVRRLWADPRTLMRVAAVIAAVVLVTLPFLLPYYQLRQLGFVARTLTETDHFSADVYAYLTADVNLWLWGSLVRGFAKPEGSLFPGLTVTALAAMAVLSQWRNARAPGRGAPTSVASLLLGAALVLSTAVLAALLLGWNLRLAIGPAPVKITDPVRVMVLIAGLAVVLLAISHRARRTAASWLSSPVGMLTLLLAFAIFMSFGPHIDSRGRTLIDTNIYAFFYAFVPGFDGLRVPARFGMMVALLLAALASYGVAALERRRQGAPLAAAAGALVLVEALALPLSVNDNPADYRQSDLAPLPASVAVGDGVPPVYRFAAQLPDSTAIVELPFGEVAFEVRYEFYSTNHWRRLLNGYSGGGPVEYGILAEVLKDALSRPERAWQALAGSGATHAIVHEGYYTGDHGPRLSDWLRRSGAREVAAFGSDRVFELPARQSEPTRTPGPLPQREMSRVR